jgi:MraZ protein
MRFTSEYESSIDDKNRVVLPSKLRDAIKSLKEGDELYISPHPDGCIQICTEPQWDRQLEQLTQRAFEDEKTRRFTRYLSASTRTGKCDKQGRLLLHGPMLAEVGIEREVYVLGHVNVIEVWDKATWLKRRAEAQREYPKDVEELP